MHWFWFLWVSSKPERQNKKESILLRFNFVKYQCAKNCNLMQTAMCTLMYFVKYKLAPWNDPDSQCFYVFFFQIQSCKLQSSRIWNRYFFLKRSLYFFCKQYEQFHHSCSFNVSFEVVRGRLRSQLAKGNFQKEL